MPEIVKGIYCLFIEVYLLYHVRFTALIVAPEEPEAHSYAP